jgi:hypothetical protein
MSKRRLKPATDQRDAADDPPMSRLFVVCSKNTSEQDFRNAFAKFGNISSAGDQSDCTT